MKNIDIPQKNSIFVRLLVVLLITIIPVYAIGISIFNWASQTVRNELVNSMISQTSFYLNNLESEIMRIKYLQDSLISDISIIRLVNNSAVMSNYDKSMNILNTRNRLDAIKNSSIYIKDVVVYIPSIDRSISATNGISQLDPGRLRKLSQVFKSRHDIIYWSENAHMISALPYKYPAQEYSSLLVEIELSEVEFKKALMQFNTYKGSGSILLSLSDEYIMDAGQNNAVKILIKKHFDSKMKNSHQGSFSFKLDGKPFLSIYIASEKLNIKLSRYVTEDEVFEKAKKFQVWLWLLLSISVIMILALSVSIYKIIYKPLGTLINSFRRIEGGEFTFRVKQGINDEFNYLFKRFNLMVERLDSLIDQVYKQKIMTQKAELKQLQAQINPHFLYNSFYILNRLIKSEEYEKSNQLSMQLGNFFQFITRNSADEVPLYREVDHAKTYARIQGMRFYDRINIIFGDLSEKYRNIVVPRLILQPVVENSLEHGLKDKEENGEIRVMFHELDEGLCIAIEDNGDNIGEGEIEKLNEKLSESGEDVEVTALINIHRRLKIKFGTQSGLLASRGSQGGLRIEMNIWFKGVNGVCTGY